MSETLKTTMLTLLVSALFGMILYATLALAQPTGVDGVTPIGSERGDLSGVTPKTQDAEAGNVTEINLSATQITNAWQGYYGNITGTLTLENSNGDVFYNWTGLGSVSGEVYASRNDSVTWANINCSNSTHISNENAFLDKQASDADSVDNTFSSQNHPQFNVGSTTINANDCSSTNAYDSTGSNTNNYYQVLLTDTNEHTVYTTIINESETGFDNAQHDFELLVGENGNSTQQGTTPYYFYIELS